jgi:hypothetical protein
MFTREHTFPDSHVIRFTVQEATGGWHVREERDGQVVFSTRCSDWHRVERKLRAFEAAIASAASRRQHG